MLCDRLHAWWLTQSLLTTLQTPLIARQWVKLSWLGSDDLSLVGPTGFNCWTSVAPAFQSWFAVEYWSYFISVINLDLYVRCFDSLMCRGPSQGPNKFYVYVNHNRT